MSMMPSIFETAAKSLPAACFDAPPDIVIVLGSGWGDALRREREIVRMPYSEIECFGAATVAGHAGEMLLYEYSGRRILAFSGRRHYYEGVGWEPVVLPLELARRMGAKQVLLTNASGGINPALRPGDFVIIRDHINTIGINPLIGPVVEGWGPRFPDMTEIYCKRLRDLLHSASGELSLRVMEGVYAFTSGPVYETPAEIRAYGHMGADIVGMSTVPEAVFAHACGMSVAGLSLVSNLAAGISPRPLAHADVIEASEKAKSVMYKLVDNFIRNA